MKALIDTCVIIDVLQNRMPFAENGQKIFLAAANNHFSGYLTAKSISDIYYIVHKSTHSDSKTRRILLTLFDLFGILDTSGTDCINAIASSISDYEDAIMLESARRENMDCIITRNKKDFKKATLPVLSPDAFLQVLYGNNES